MDYNLFDTVQHIWALGKCAIEIIYLLLLLLLFCQRSYGPIENSKRRVPGIYLETLNIEGVAYIHT